jgi:nucleoside-diphosphate-sugar epimerase
MKILVTGATGLLGSALCPLLRNAGHEVRAMVRQSASTDLMDVASMEIVTGNVLEPESLAVAARGVDAVVHAAAAVMGRDEEAMRRVNVDGTYALIDAVRRHDPGIRFVLVSSIAAGGFGTTQHPLREDMIPRPATTYGRTRLEAEEIVREHASRMDCTVLRLPLMYGPRDRFFLPLYRLIAFGITLLPEGGSMEMCLLHADDAARAIVKLLETHDPGADTFYVADDRPVPWKRYCGVVQAALGRSVSMPVNVNRNVLRRVESLLDRLSSLPDRLERRIPPDACPDVARLLLGRGLVCDASLFRERTGWSARLDLAQGVRRTIAWHRDHDLL